MSKDIPSLNFSFAPPTLDISVFGDNSTFVCDTNSLKLVNPVPRRDCSFSYSGGKINLDFNDIGFYYLDATYYSENDPSISFKVRFWFAAEIELYINGFDPDTSRPYTVYYTPDEETNVSIPISVKRSDGKPITIDDADYKALKAYIFNEDNKVDDPDAHVSDFGDFNEKYFTLTPVDSADNTVAKYTLDIAVPADFDWDNSRDYADFSFGFNLEPKDYDTTPHPYWINGWGNGEDCFRVRFEAQSEKTEEVTLDYFRFNSNYFTDEGTDGLIKTIKYNKPIQLGTNGVATITMPRGAINWRFKRGDEYLGGYFRPDKAAYRYLTTTIC